MAGFGPLLTQFEYDFVLNDEARAALAAIPPRFPSYDQKGSRYRAKFGPYRSGALYADPVVYQQVGYGYPYPQLIPPSVPVIPIESYGDLP
jgi:hypothetical protein